MTSRRDVPLLWISQAASQLGTSVSSIAYPLLVLQLSGSAFQAGLVGTVIAATGLVARLPGGMLADRFPSRALMLGADALRSAILASLAVTVALGRTELWFVLLVVALEVTAGAAFGPAEFSLLRAIVPPPERAIAVGRMQSRVQVAALIGPLLGGALFGIAPWVPFAVDAASYLASLVLVLAIRARFRPPRSAGKDRGLAAGLHWIRSDGFLLPAGLWVAALTAAFSAVGLVVIVLARDRGASPAETGAMYTISAAGGLLGALLTPAIQRRWRPVTVFRAAAIIDTGAALALLPLHSPYLIGVAGAAAFLLAPAVSASLFGELSRRAPDELVGRAQASLGLLVGAVAPLSSAGIGAVTDARGTAAGILTCAGAFAVLAVAAFLIPGFGRARDGRA
jgi:MFS family permease